jgi:hypothetical protein
MAWKLIDQAPVKTWILVTWDKPPKNDEQGGPWDYGYARQAPPPPAMVAIFINGHWRAYSEDGGIYGMISDPDKFMELPI